MVEEQIKHERKMTFKPEEPHIARWCPAVLRWKAFYSITACPQFRTYFTICPGWVSRIAHKVRASDEDVYSTVGCCDFKYEITPKW